jgi:anti-anti-sigma factor
MSELATVTATDLEGARLLSISGEIDLSNVDTLTTAISRLVGSDAHLVVVDLSRTTYVDSAGLAMLFRLAERLGYSRQELRLVVPPASAIRRVVELTNLDRVIRVEETIPRQQDPDPR